MAEAAEESVHLKKGEENTLTQQQVKRMIDYLSQHTDYKVLTTDEYQLLKPVAQSSPWAGVARPKTTEGTRLKTTFKFEEEEEDEPTNHHQSGFVFDSSTVRPRFSTFSGEKNARLPLMFGRMM